MCRSRTGRRTLLAVLLALGLAAGCGGGSADSHEGSRDAPAKGAREAVPATRPAVFDWKDPEPPDAQQRAEAVVDAPFNRNKRTEIVPHVVPLSMNITTVVPHTTGLTGFRSAVVANEGSLDDRLDAIGARRSETEITIRMAGSVLFDFDSDRIRPDAERSLEQVAGILRDIPDRPVRIEGHTDSIASEAYNQRLSERRAESVRRWLVHHGIDAKRLEAIGFGETKPIADNATPEGRQQNRRVEIVIETGGSSE